MMRVRKGVANIARFQFRLATASVIKEAIGEYLRWTIRNYIKSAYMSAPIKIQWPYIKRKLNDIWWVAILFWLVHKHRCLINLTSNAPAWWIYSAAMLLLSLLLVIMRSVIPFHTLGTAYSLWPHKTWTRKKICWEHLWHTTFCIWPCKYKKLCIFLTWKCRLDSYENLLMARGSGFVFFTAPT